MKANLEFLKDRFHRFNHEIFINPLPVPEFHITNARTFVGQFRYERTGSILKRTETRHLSLSACYDLPERVLEDIVIHEMIHYHIHHHNIHDASSHGPAFRSLMKEINRRFGRNVTVSHKCTKEQLDSDDSKTHSIVCLCTMRDGRRLVCRAAQSRVFEIHRGLENWPEVISEEWYWVYGSYFNRYRRVQTVKLYAVDDEGLDIIKAGTRLEFSIGPGGEMVLRPGKQ